MKLVLFIILSLFPLGIRADQPRHRDFFTSANDKYELRFINGEWSLTEKSTKQELYRLRESIGSMTVLIGNDGKSVVAVDDYSEQAFNQNPEVLLFYHNGKKIKGYKLGELLDDTNFISVSVSHFRWLFRSQDLRINGSRVSFTTFEMNQYTFDSETGEILTKEKDRELSEDAIYVYGEVRGLGGSLHEIIVKCVVHGQTEKGSKLQFESDKFRWDGKGFNESLILRNGRLISKKGIIFNACNNSPR